MPIKFLALRWGGLSTQRPLACARRSFSPQRVGAQRNSRPVVQPRAVSQSGNCRRSISPTAVSLTKDTPTTDRNRKSSHHVCKADIRPGDSDPDTGGGGASCSLEDRQLLAAEVTDCIFGIRITASVFVFIVDDTPSVWRADGIAARFGRIRGIRSRWQLGHPVSGFS